MKKKVLLVLVVLLLAAALLGAQGKKILLGFSHVAMNNPYYLAMDKAARDTAAARGADIIVLNADEDISKQIADIESLLVKGIKGLIVNSTTEYGTMPIIKKVKAMGIPGGGHRPAAVRRLPGLRGHRPVESRGAAGRVLHQDSCCPPAATSC